MLEVIIEYLDLDKYGYMIYRLENKHFLSGFKDKKTMFVVHFIILNKYRRIKIFHLEITFNKFRNNVNFRNIFNHSFRFCNHMKCILFFGY